MFPRWILGGAAIPTTIAAVDAFVNPANILILALLIGVIHINMGLVFGAYNNITRGDVREALGAQIVWFVLEIGVVILAAVYLTTGSLMSGAIFGGPILLLSLIMLVYFNGAFGLMDLNRIPWNASVLRQAFGTLSFNRWNCINS